MLFLQIVFFAYWFGPSGATRTRGFHIPNVAPYQLGYTRIFGCHDYSTKLVRFKVFSCLWSFMWSKRVFGPVLLPGKIQQTPVLQGVPGFGCFHHGYMENRSQSRRATSCATPGYHAFFAKRGYYTKSPRLVQGFYGLMFSTPCAIMWLTLDEFRRVIHRANET